MPLAAISSEGLVECPKTVFPKEELNSFMAVGEKFVGCDKQYISQEELCHCAEVNSSLMPDQAQSDELSRIASEKAEKAWAESYKKEVLSIAQGLFDLDAMTRNNIEDAEYLKENLNPSCNISSILNSISSFGSSENCDKEVFNKRVKKVFGAEDLAAIQQDYTSKLSRLIENQVPDQFKNDAKVCLPYSTYNYSKNLNILKSRKMTTSSDAIEEKVVNVKVKELNKRCLKLQDPKVSNLFCKQELPTLPLESFQANVSPALSSDDSYSVSNLYSSGAYCSSEVVTGDNLSSFINVTNSDESDFERFMKEDGGDYEKFNQSVCKFLPECDGGKSNDKSCRNILNLRQMTLDNLDKQLSAITPSLPPKIKAKLLEEFAYDPESIKYNEYIKKIMNKEELEDVKGFLAYLNNFIIDKNKGDQTLRDMANGSGSREEELRTFAAKKKKILKSLTTPIKELNIEGEVGSIKDPKVKAFRETRRLTAIQFDLDNIEESELSKKFLEGPAVENPIFNNNPTPSNIPSPEVANTQPVNDPDSNTPASVPAPANTNPTNNENNVFRVPTRPSSKPNELSPSRISNSDSSSNTATKRNSVSGFSGTNSFPKAALVPSTPSSSGSKAYKSGSKGNFETPSRAKSKQDFSTNSRAQKSFGNEIDRYKNVIDNLPACVASGSQSQALEDGRSIANEGTSEAEGAFGKEETSKKAPGSSGTTSSKGAKKKDGKKDDAKSAIASNPAKGLKDKNGKFVPAYMYKYILPHLIVDVFGVEEVVKKYNLYGKRFYTLEITDEETFILHTYDFESSSVPFVSGTDDQEYNSVRIEMLEQIQNTLAQSKSSKVLAKILENTDHREEKLVKTEVEQIRLSENMIPFEDVEKRFAQN